MKLYCLACTILCSLEIVAGPGRFDVEYENAYSGIKVVVAITSPEFWRTGTVNGRKREVSHLFCKAGVLTNVVIFAEREDTVLHYLSSLPYDREYTDPTVIAPILERKHHAYSYDLLCEGETVLRAREFVQGTVTDFVNDRAASKLSGLYKNSLMAVQLSIGHGSDGQGVPIDQADVHFYIRTMTKADRAQCETIAKQVFQFLERTTVWIFLSQDGEFRYASGPHFDVFGPWPKSPAEYVARHRSQVSERIIGCVIQPKKGIVEFTQ